jgi:signal transduction histidine kinase
VFAFVFAFCILAYGRLYLCGLAQGREPLRHCARGLGARLRFKKGHFCSDEDSVKIMTREELGLRVRSEASLIVLLTAMIFVLAGSLWAHFALNDSFFNGSFFALWLLLHAQPFLMLSRRRLLRPLGILAFATLQIYLYFAFYRLQMPFIPMAPLFFVVMAQCLPLFQSAMKWLSWVYWATAWVSVSFWMGQGAEAQGTNIYLPIGIALGIGLLFLSCFTILHWVFAKRLSSHMAEFGPKEKFDIQRIQASKLQTMGELTASLLHEINNPLTNINGYSHQIAEALRENDPHIIDITRDANERIKFNVDRIKDITSAVRRLVRPGHNNHSEQFSVRDLLEDSVTLMKHHLKALGMELKVDYDSNDYQVQGNFTELSQILVNLLSNARDAIRDAEIKVISLGFKGEGAEVHVWVQDTGPGVPQEYAEEVFKPFFTTKAHQEGTGLGLYISKLIAERNRAKLEFECLKDRHGRVLGTRFSLRLKNPSFESKKAA